VESNIKPVLTRKQGAILSFLFENVELGQEVDTLDFRLRGDFSGRYLAAHSRLDDDLHLVFTLPTYSDSVFFGVAKGKAIDVASVLANLEDYERQHSQLQLGEALRLPDEAKQYPALYALLLLRAATLLKLKGLPDRVQIDGTQVKFALAVPLSLDEYEHRRLKGHDSLMEEFQLNGKVLAIA
jgi:hypothetical protein